jgi:hypothetical protein
MGRRFIILYEEKEGSTPVVQLLNNFDTIDVVHLESNKGYEPFDWHSCGTMPLRNYRQCLELIYGDRNCDMTELNAIYTATAQYPIAPFDKQKALGLKMRFRPQDNRRLRRWLCTPRFAHLSYELFQKHNVVVFVTVRQDVFRWALSKYHGDGTGQPGHLQFKLAKGQVERADIPPVMVDRAVFQNLLIDCEDRINRKRMLIEKLTRRGISAYPLFYERFCNERFDFFAEITRRLELPVTNTDISSALNRGTRLEKVHSTDIRDFVVNAEEVLAEFGERYVKW